MHAQDHIVFIVDDDARVRDALAEVLSSVGLNPVTFESASAYVEFPRPQVPACLILDMRLPDIDGLELQSQLAGGLHPPIVFISGHGDVPSSVRAIKAGAVDFLMKPVASRDLIAAVQTAISLDREARMDHAVLAGLKGRLSLLTPRERSVMPLVVSGLLNKQAAAELGISEVTLQIHRGRIMRKMKAKSLAELVRMAALLRVPMPTREPT